MKCVIQWIDDQGKHTADDNEAIGLAVCVEHHVMEYAMEQFGHVRAYPVCEAHAKRAGAGWLILNFRR